MKFSELYEELIEVLAENSAAAPQYWSVAELKRYLNRGLSELCKICRLTVASLPLIQAETGAFYLPADLLRLEKIYYQGKYLDKVSVEYLDSAYGGTSHGAGLRGDGNYFSSSWRAKTGSPIHWYFENGKIKLFPKPETSLTIDTIRQELIGTYSAGDTGITIAGAIPLNKNRVDLFMGGVKQFKDQWQIDSATRITFKKDSGATWTPLDDNDYCIRYIPDSISMDVISGSEKYLVYAVAGQRKIVVPGGYTVGIGALEVSVNGIEETDYAETSTGYITLDDGLVVDSIVEFTVTRPDPMTTASALYLQKPVDLSDDNDQPQFEQEEWQRGIVHYAAHLALTKEGKMTQDIQKGAIHLQRFNEIVDDVLSVTGSDVNVSDSVSMPFIV